MRVETLRIECQKDEGILEVQVGDYTDAVEITSWDTESGESLAIYLTEGEARELIEFLEEQLP